MFHVAICDEDKNDIEYIKKTIVKSGLHKSEVIFYEYYSEEEFLMVIEEGTKVDLLILETKIDENKVAKEFRKKYYNTTLIFYASINALSPEIIKVCPYRFLLKEYSDKELIEEFKDIITYLKEKKRTPIISGYDGYSHLQIAIDEVMYISIAKRGSHVHVYDGVLSRDRDVIFCKKKVEELYEILKDYDFAYVHNSYIVNFKFIKERTKEEIQLMNGEILSVSRSRTRELRNKMELYLNKINRKEF